jgi:aspartate/methionine/tyrosine aminotransferase
MVVALGDDAHVAQQKQRYAARRATLAPALERAGFTIDRSEAGLYLWVTRGDDAWATVAWFAERGILVAPGTFYGDDSHVRIAITATDADVEKAALRLSSN